jgi:hypothetical protein
MLTPKSKQSNQTQKNSSIPVAPPPQGVHQVYRLLLSRLLLREKACIKSFNSTCRSSHFHIPLQRDLGSRGHLDSKEARLACANLYFHSALGGLAILTCLVGYMMVCLSLLHPTNGEVSFVSTIPILNPTFQPGASRTFSRSGLAGSVFTNVPAAARPESEKK